MRKAISTKVLRAVPVEFKSFYVQYGQQRCERMYGKRATMRYRRAIGKLTLNRLRRAFLRGARYQPEAVLALPAPPLMLADMRGEA